MAMHRQHPNPQFDLPISPTKMALPAASLSHPLTVDVTVSEWTADLSAGSGPITTLAPTAVGAVAFIDFDALDSVHEANASSIAVKP